MSLANPRRKKTVWDIEFDKRVPAPDLAAFNRHKKVLLTILRKAHGRGSKSEPFNKKESWRDLSHLAQLYFWDAKIKQEATPNAVRVKRLRQLARDLGQARHVTDSADQGELGHDLFRACFGDDDGSFDPVYLADTIKAVVAGLVTLETAANRAVIAVHNRGRPSGDAVLPSPYIIALGGLYRKNTGLTPDTGETFAQLVRKFLTAIGQPEKGTGEVTSPEYVDEAIKYALRKERRNPSGWPSPFE